MSLHQIKKSRVAGAARAVVGGGLLATCLAFGTSAQAGLTFNFDYSFNTADVGFLEAGAVGLARRDALTLAGTKFSELFGTYFSDSATIVLQVTSSDNSSSTTLASAGSLLVSQATTSTPGGFILGEVVRTKLQGGVDLNSASADGTVDVNFGNLWELDYNTEPTAGFYDFYSTLFHEFTHAIGFASTISQGGKDIFGTTTGTGQSEWSKFDSFMTQCGTGTNIIDPTTSEINSSVWSAASIGNTASGSNGLCFSGANAMAANGNSPVELYSPETWKEGSSGSHLNTDNPQFTGFPQNLGAMMRHDGAPGSFDTRTYGAIEVAMLTDLGYTRVAAVGNNVPEPGSLALLLAGLAGVTLVRRRNKA